MHQTEAVWRMKERVIANEEKYEYLIQAVCSKARVINRKKAVQKNNEIQKGHVASRDLCPYSPVEGTVVDRLASF